MISLDELKRKLRYVPETGEFIRISTGRRAGFRKGSEGYRGLGFNGKRYGEHVLAFFYMTGRWPVTTVDHINGITDDNRWENLREADHAEQARNRKLPINNVSGVAGVSWNKQAQRWIVRITVEGYRTSFCFVDFFEAVCCRKSLERRYGYTGRITGSNT